MDDDALFSQVSMYTCETMHKIRELAHQHQHQHQHIIPYSKKTQNNNNTFNILFFDTETTGLIPRGNLNATTVSLFPHIVQLAYLVYNVESGRIVLANNHIIKVGPDVEITPGSELVHGISAAKCSAEGIPIHIAMAQFTDACRMAPFGIICHNTDFDTKLIRAEFLRLRQTRDTKKNMEYFLNRLPTMYCTMKNTTEFCQLPHLRECFKNKKDSGDNYKWPKLDELHFKLFGEKPRNLHDAMNDVIITVRCFMKYYYDYDVSKQMVFNLLLKPLIHDL